NGFTPAPGFRPRQTRFLQHGRSWRWGGVHLLASLERANLLFSPSSTSLCLGAPVSSVVTIHDLIPAVLPWKSKRTALIMRLMSWSAARFSRGIITDSAHSKNDLVNLYGVTESKIEVVYLGCDTGSFNDAPANPDFQQGLLSRLGIVRPYVVHHGVIKPYKN